MSLFVIKFDLLIVDRYPVQLTAGNFVIILVAILIVGVFCYIKFLSQFYNKKALKYIDKSPNKYIGQIIFLLQVLNFLALLMYDFGRVGGVSNSSKILALLVSYLPSDVLFLLYYGHHRKKGVPYFNLLLYIIINVLKGWSGIFLILFFIEIYFQLSKRPFKKTAKIIFVSVIFIFSLYPTINKYKYIIRGGEDYQQQSLLESAGELSIRLQHTTNVILISQEAKSLKNELMSGSIFPYYFDNRIGNYLKKFGSMNLQKYLTVNYLMDKNLFSSNTDIDELGWYTHIGIVGWFFVLDPIEIILYLVFITLLIITPFLLNHYFLKSEGLIPVIQTLTFAYIFHGWFTVHVAFISGVILYIFLFNIFNKKNTIRFD